MKRLRTILLVTIAYWVSARLGLLLAIPPGYATAVWPPSGVGLGAVLICGYWVLPGIWLGSFLANVQTALDGHAFLPSLLLPTGISLGAAAQAAVSTYLVRRFVDHCCALVEDRDIFKFFLLGGPVGCCINASISVTLLLLLGKTSLTGYALNWLTWWAGDTIGVMIFTPLMLVLFGKPGAIWKMRRRTVALPLCLTFALVTAVFFNVREDGQQRRQQEFHRLADLAIHNIEDEFQRYQIALDSLRGMFDSSQSITQEAFHIFAKQLTSHVNGLQAVEWALHVPNSQRGLFESEQKNAADRVFSIRERNAAGQLQTAADRDEYVVVTYIEPMDANRPALGYDLASEPKRRMALERARDTNQLSATAPIELVQETRHQSGALLFLPVYDPQAPSATVEQRQLALKGYVLGVLRVGDVMDTALSFLGGERKKLRLRLSDEDADVAVQAFFADLGFSTQSELLAQQTLNWGGRDWLLEISGRYEDFGQTLATWYVLLGGMLFCGMLSGFLLILTGRTLQVEAIVLERTQALTDRNTQLGQEIADRQRTEAALRVSEEQFRLIIRKSPIPFAINNMKGVIEMLNDRFIEAFGYTLEDIPSLDAWWKLAYPDEAYRRQVSTDWLDAVASTKGEGMDIQSDGIRIICKDGSQRIADIRGVFIGERLLVMLNDITMRRVIEDELKNVNESLEQRIREEIAKSHEKDHLIIQQSRFAAMGEMIGNIAHQWRQPLNALGLTLANLQDAYEYNELTGEYLLGQVKVGNQLIQKMSTTIDDFRHFFRPSKERQIFSAKQAIEEAMALVSASFNNNNISLELEIVDDALIQGFPNEFSQVLLNLFANAKDAILARRISKGNVRIKIAMDGSWVTVTMADNGGGIPDTVLGKIFEPYFSTKEMGTGIGLYMSKVIIEESMKGHLDVRNYENGAEFSIRCPLGHAVKATGK